MKGCTVNAPTQPKVPAGPIKHPAQPAQPVSQLPAGSRNANFLMTEVLALWERVLVSEMPWSGVREGCAPLHIHGTVVAEGQTQGRTVLDTWDRVRVRHGGAEQILSSVQSGEGYAAAGHCPVHGGHLPGISVCCSTAGQGPSHSDNQALRPPQPTLGGPGDCQWLSPEEGEVGLCVCKQWWSNVNLPGEGGDLLDTLPALALVPQSNIDLLARCLSPPSMPPLPAHRTPVALQGSNENFCIFLSP